MRLLASVPLTLPVDTWLFLMETLLPPARTRAVDLAEGRTFVV